MNDLQDLDALDERSPQEARRAPRGRVRVFPDADAVPEAVQWQEGMLLTPHHFQQTVRRTEELLAYQAGQLGPYGWGVRHLRVDEDALSSGWFRVAELEAVLPDGMVVTLPEDQPLEVGLEDYEKELAGDDPVPVFLAVPRRRWDGASAIGQGGRFRSVEGASVIDENTGQGEHRVRRLRPRLSLLVTDKPSGAFVKLPLARLQSRDQQLRLAPYVAPRMTVEAGSEIAARVTRIALALFGKARYLSQSRTAQTVATRLKIQALVSGLPLLEELLYSEAVHPRELYLALCGLAGPLALLRAEEPLPPEMPRYDHADLLTTFEGARAAIAQVLDEGVSERYTEYVFQLEKQRGVFHLYFEPRWRERDLVLAVRRGAGQTQRDLETWMEGAIIGSRTFVTEMQKNRVLGVGRRQVSEHEHLTTSSRVTLYSLRSASKYLQEGEPLLVFHPESPERPLEIVLHVGNPEGRGGSSDVSESAQTIEAEV